MSFSVVLLDHSLCTDKCISDTLAFARRVSQSFETCSSRLDIVFSYELCVLFQDGKLALLGCNNCFMSVAPDDDSVVATSKKVGPDEIVQVRSHAVKEVTPGSKLPEEEQGSLAQIEINYV